MRGILFAVSSCVLSTACLLTIDDSLVDRRDGGSAVDASFDTMPNDAASGDTSVDASRDGGVCPVGAIFCDDFQSGDLTKWTNLSGDLSKCCNVKDDPTAPGNKALRVDATSHPSEWASHADASLTLPASGDVRVALRLFRQASSGEIFPFGAFVGNLELAYRFGTPEKLVEQGSAPFAAYDTPAVPSGKWVAMSVVLRRTAGAVEVTVDGTTVRAPASGKLGGATELAKVSLSLLVGIYDAAPGTSWSGWIDDVVVTSL